MKYSERLLFYFNNCPHVGELNSKSPSVKCSEWENFEHRTHLKLMVEMFSGKITTARFQAYGSPVYVALMEYVCEWLENKTIEQMNYFSVDEVMQLFELPETLKHKVIVIERLLKNLAE